MTYDLDACPKLKELRVCVNARDSGREECLKCDLPKCYHDLPFRERCGIGHRLAKTNKGKKG